MAADPHVLDVKFWTGLRIDPHLVLGSMAVLTDRQMDVMVYNPYDLAFDTIEESQLNERRWHYSVEFIVHDDGGSTTADLLFQAGCILLPPVLVKDDLELDTVLALQSGNLRRLLDILKREGRDTRLISVRSTGPDQRLSSLSTWKKSLTPKQLNALRIALQRGYYRYPRKVRISDLAQSAGLARSTFQEHLRLAEIGVIRHVLEGEIQDVDETQQDLFKEARKRHY